MAARVNEASVVGAGVGVGVRVGGVMSVKNRSSTASPFREREGARISTVAVERTRASSVGAAVPERRRRD
jgi:hypothetical protein